MNKQSDKCKECLKNAKGRILPCEINKNDCQFIEVTRKEADNEQTV